MVPQAKAKAKAEGDPTCDRYLLLPRERLGGGMIGGGEG